MFFRFQNPTFTEHLTLPLIPLIHFAGLQPGYQVSNYLDHPTVLHQNCQQRVGSAVSSNRRFVVNRNYKSCPIRLKSFEAINPVQTGPMTACQRIWQAPGHNGYYPMSREITVCASWLVPHEAPVVYSFLLVRKPSKRIVWDGAQAIFGAKELWYQSIIKMVSKFYINIWRISLPFWRIRHRHYSPMIAIIR